jgi:glycosyltransferase involved in cell wall biosynthesis
MGGFFCLQMNLKFSLVVPVYNRPEELGELLESLSGQDFDHPFEVVIVEDGSVVESIEVVNRYRDRLLIKYLPKANTGPGDSRNYGMERATGNYFILVDSDCILPADYFFQVSTALAAEYVDCFGGRDAAHTSFNAFQKAVSFSMTSTLTTGGLRGSANPQKDFQPRSFNMGLSKAAFERSEGFGNIHPGEDPDLSLRLKAMGFRIRFFPNVIVYHKRRINIKLFFRQVKKFGLTRPILNRWHPGSAKITYWFPAFFMLGFFGSLLLPLFLKSIYSYIPIGIYGLYFMLLVLIAGLQYRNFKVGLLAPLTSMVQFLGYGFGFLKSYSLITFSRKSPEALMPGLFFKR